MATEVFILEVRTRGAKKAAADVRRIGKAGDSVRKTMAFLRSALVAVAAIRIFGSITSSLVEFSDQMLVVKAVTRSTAEQFMDLRDVAKGLGATTRFTAGEAAEGMAFLARAGLGVSEVMGAIPATLNLAAAAQLDLGRAADIASNIMTSFGREVAELPDIMDTLVFTANNANTTVQQLADGLKLFAPIASQLGISLKDASAAMAILGDAGIQASLAGTGIRRVLTDLEAPTGNLAKALKFLGINFAEVRPSMVGFEGALKRLKIANVGASAASLLFGKRGGFIAAQLLKAIGPTGDFRKELERITGTAKRAAEELESGLGGALRLVRSALQNLLITFSDLGAEEFLNQFFRGMAAALRSVATHAEAVTRAIKLFFAAIVLRKLVLLAPALWGAAIAMAALVKSALLAPIAFLRATVSATALATAMNLIPFAAIITALGLALIAMTAFGDEIVVTGTKATTFSDILTTMSDDIAQSTVNVFNNLGGDFVTFGDILDTTASKVAGFVQGVGAFFSGLVAFMSGVWDLMILGITDWLKWWATLVLKLKSGVNEIQEAFGKEGPFDLTGNTEEVARLTSKVEELVESAREGGNLLERFAFGVGEFDQRVADTTKNRVAAELAAIRDAAILATENADRLSAKLREAREPKVTDGGVIIDLEAIAKAEKAAAALVKAAKEMERLRKALRDLEAEYFPLIAVQEAEAAVLKTINDAADKGIVLMVNQEELLKRAARAQLGLGITVDQAAEQQQVYDDALRTSTISLAEHLKLTRDLNIELLENTPGALAGMKLGLLQVSATAEDVGAQISDAMVGAFNEATDAFLEFVKTGKFSFKSLIDFILIELTRLAFQKSVVASLSNLFFSVLGGGVGAAGTGAGLSTDIAKGVSPSDAPGTPFAQGGSFTIGNNDPNSIPFSGPGPDDRLVQFRGKTGETVDITPSGGKQGGGDMTRNLTIHQNFNIHNPTDPDGFKRSQPAIAVRGLQAAERFKQRIG